MTEDEKIKQFEDKIREQIKEVAEKLSLNGDAPSPSVLLAMLGYQMYIDKFYLSPDRIRQCIEYLLLGYEMAKEDEENNSQNFTN